MIRSIHTFKHTFIYKLNIYISKLDLNYKTKHLQQIMELKDFKTMLYQGK